MLAERKSDNLLHEEDNTSWMTGHTSPFLVAKRNGWGEDRYLKAVWEYQCRYKCICFMYLKFELG